MIRRQKIAPRAQDDPAIAAYLRAYLQQLEAMLRDLVVPPSDTLQ